MIYIDARDPLSLKQGVIDFLDLTEKELEQVFETMDSVEGNLYDWVKSFLEDYGIDLPLDSIQMFHLTRRLNGADLTSNNNLEQLLLGETPLSDFFKRYDVTFKSVMDIWKCIIKDLYNRWMTSFIRDRVIWRTSSQGWVILMLKTIA